MPVATAATTRSHVAPVQTRDELLYLLTRASEIEHDLACVYLYAGYSLKNHPSEGGMTAQELETVRGWKQRIARVGVEEMLHLAQVSNLLTAIGGAPHFARSNFPMPHDEFPFGIKLALEPISIALLERLVCYEMPEEGVLPADREPLYKELAGRVVVPADHRALQARNAIEPFDIDFRTVGEFYHKIESGFKTIDEAHLFIGPPEAQSNPLYLDLGNLVQVANRESACRAIEMIVEQGESPTKDHPDAHFNVFDSIRREYIELSERAHARGATFDPVRPLIANPATRGYDGVTGANIITDPVAREVADLFNVTYDTMLMMLLRFFAHGEETEEEMRLLARGTLRMMASVLRPLGEGLAQLPAGPEYPGRNAGPPFGYNRSVHLLAHKEAAWIFFLERLYRLSRRATALSEETALPPEITEAAAALESVAEHLTPFIPKTFAASIAEAADEENARTTIRPEVNGPLIVRNLKKLTNSLGETLATRQIVALCRCGGSKIKPYCDGTHATNGFESAKSADRTPDRLDEYVAPGITVRDNRGTCCHFGNCTEKLPDVFHHASEPFVTADGAPPQQIIDIVRACPSGALGYVFEGAEYSGEDRDPEIYVAHNASYYVRGGITLEGEAPNTGASLEHYALCRCGQSKNKPFCDGSHWYAKFDDPDN